MARSEVSSLLVVDRDGSLLGIVTTRDLLFEDRPDRPITEVMTAREALITAPVGTGFVEARRILHEHRLEKLPLVDEAGHLRGLVTAREVLRQSSHPSAARDKQGRLLVGAAIGAVGDYIERAEALVAAGVDVLVVYIANMATEHAICASA